MIRATVMGDMAMLPKTPRKVGHPPGSILYTPELSVYICEELAKGIPLRQVCALEGMPAESTVRSWVIDDAEFGARYARARGIGLDMLAEGTLEIADDQTEDPNSRRVRIDTRKWLLSKMAPKKYGERLELAGDKDAPLIPPRVVVEFVDAVAQIVPAVQKRIEGGE